MEFLATTTELRDYVETGVFAAADCPCDHEGCFTAPSHFCIFIYF